MSLQAYTVGAVVRLRSGSPAMTVTDIYPDGQIGTFWFHDGELRRGMFNPQTLTEGNIRVDRNDNAR